MMEELLGMDDFSAECRIYKHILSREDMSNIKTRDKFDMCKICSFMVKYHAKTASILTQLYKPAVTAG